MKKIESVSKAGEMYEIYYDDKTKRVISLEAIKGGISWPNPDSPAYFCIIGKYSLPNKTLKKALVLLSEAQADLPEEIIRDLYNEARKLQCREFFGEYEDATLTY